MDTSATHDSAVRDPQLQGTEHEVGPQGSVKRVDKSGVRRRVRRLPGVAQMAELDDPDCAKPVNILNKTTIDGKTKKASDPLFNMAAQLLATRLNVTGGAGTCPDHQRGQRCADAASQVRLEWADLRSSVVPGADDGRRPRWRTTSTTRSTCTTTACSAREGRHRGEQGRGLGTRPFPFRPLDAMLSRVRSGCETAPNDARSPKPA
jgi:hypothetical protein